MDVFAAVMTDQGVGAISTIGVFGDKAEGIVRKIFKPVSGKSITLKPGSIFLGMIVDGKETIDQVALGCEGEGNFAIHCHGNPLIVEMIMRLLRKCGAQLVTTEQLLAKILSAGKTANTIELEVKLAQLKARTIEGSKIIANQIDGGLSKKANQWLENTDKADIEEIKTEVKQVLKTSQAAKLIINGCTIVLAGPANTGKSTLLNYLAGKQKAIVTDIKGTTRDWVSCSCRIGRLLAEVIDTAGLDEELLEKGQAGIEKEAQRRSVEILEGADLVLFVLDKNQSAEQIDDRLVEKIAGKKIITALNKSDLPAKLDESELPQVLSNTVLISAKLGDGVESLIEKIQEVCEVTDFDSGAEVAFTVRQEKLLEQLAGAKTRQEAVSAITELLNGEVCV